MRYLTVDTATKISKIGLGTWQFGSRGWGYGKPYAEGESRAIVARALELGVTLFDTAEIYGRGRSERILGQAIDGHRDEIFLATKILPVAPVPAVVQQRAVASASRLGVSKLDLYQVHQPNPLFRDTVIMRGMRRCSGSAWSARSASATTRWTGGGPPRRRSARGCLATRCATTWWRRRRRTA